MGKVAKNDITHAEIKTTYNSKEYQEGYERIFGESKLDKRIREEKEKKEKTLLDNES